MKRGFTLIELLAVIAILAIVLLIAIPNVIEVVTASKNSAFEKNEQMLSKMAITYLSSNLNIVPTNSGDLVKVSYSTLKSSQYINDILDPIDRSECVNSRVIIEKDITNKYIYTPIVFCTNKETKIGGIKIIDDFTGVIKINYADNVTVNVGEIFVSAGTITRYNNTSVVTPDRMVVSQLEGAGIAEANAYLMYIGSNTTRFTSVYSYDTFLITKYDADKWYYTDNSAWIEFTPNENDYLLGKVTKENADAGITNFQYYYEK